jgi:RND family efflux transporter MFP subunit
VRRRGLTIRILRNFRNPAPYEEMPMTITGRPVSVLRIRSDRAVHGWRPARRSRSFAVPIALVLALLPALTGCGQRKSESIDSVMREGVYGGAIPVETLALVPREFEDRFEAAGVIEAEEEVTVSAEIAGRALQVHREIGDPVRSGALLVTIDSAEIEARIKRIEAQLAKARTQLDWARKDLARQEKLFATQVAAERAFDEASRLTDTGEDEVAAAEADLELARVELSRTKIRSPIDGQVARRHLSAGEYVREGTPLYDLVATDRVKFVFSVAERDVPALRTGEALEVLVDAHGGRAFPATVRAVAPAGAAETRTFRVELEIANEAEHALLPGMSGRTSVARRRFEEVFLLPEQAILRDENGSYVYLADSDRARRAPVEILSQVGDQAVISTALGSTTDCIILGQAALEPGAAIRVRRRHETPPESRFD